jgi:hypothetical protein
VAKIKGDAKLSDKERFEAMAPLGEKEVASNAVMKGLQEAKTKLADQVADKAPVEIPEARFGFDQWLLDPAKK